jgi:hypothetical protein
MAGFAGGTVTEPCAGLLARLRVSQHLGGLLFAKEFLGSIGSNEADEVIDCSLVFADGVK